VKPDQLEGSAESFVAMLLAPLVMIRGKRAFWSALGKLADLSAMAMFFTDPRKVCQAETEVEFTLKAPLLTSTAADRR
jgi:hypothetical protein